MDTADLTLDGNAAAGLLRALLPFEPTTSRSCCAACAAVHELGALSMYAPGIGVVLRCPDCSAVMIRVVHGGGRYWLDLRGTRYLMVPEPAG